MRIFSDRKYGNPHVVGMALLICGSFFTIPVSFGGVGKRNIRVITLFHAWLPRLERSHELRITRRPQGVKKNSISLALTTKTTVKPSGCGNEGPRTHPDEAFLVAIRASLSLLVNRGIFSRRSHRKEAGLIPINLIRCFVVEKQRRRCHACASPLPPSQVSFVAKETTNDEDPTSSVKKTLSRLGARFLMAALLT